MSRADESMVPDSKVMTVSMSIRFHGLSSAEETNYQAQISTFDLRVSSEYEIDSIEARKTGTGVFAGLEVKLVKTNSAQEKIDVEKKRKRDHDESDKPKDQGGRAKKRRGTVSVCSNTAVKGG